MKKLFGLLIVAFCTLGLVGYAVGQNLVPNPGFESWTVNGPTGPPDNWVEDAVGSITGTQEAVQVYSGTFSCNLTWTSPTQADCDFQTDEFAVTAATEYAFGVYAYDNDVAGRITIAVDWYDNTHTYLNSYYTNLYTSDSGSWQLLSGTRTSDASAAFASFRIRGYDVSATWDGDATVYVDDAYFESSGPPPPPDTLTIYQIQYTTTASGTCYDSPHVGETIVTSGIVTAVQTGGYYIQDAEAEWSGVYVYDYGHSPAMGDEIKFKANVSEYYGMTELGGVEDYVLLSSGNYVDPLAIETGDLAGGCNIGSEAFEGVLCCVKDVSCTQDLNTHNEWFVDDGSGECQIDDNMYFYDPYVGETFDGICGVVDYSFNEYGLLPRVPHDIGPPCYVELTSFEAVAGDGQVSLTWQTAAEVGSHSFNIYRDKQIIATVDAFGDAHDYIYVDRTVENGTTYSYQLSDVNLDGTETLHQMVCSVTPTAVPTTYALFQNYPNPFNPSTDIRYAIPTEAHVTLKVYNLLGQEVASLVDEVKQAGRHTVSWNAADQASGVYFYRLQTDDFSATRKMVFMK